MLCFLYTAGDAAAAQAMYALEKGGMLPSDRPVLTHCQVAFHHGVTPL